MGMKPSPTTMFVLSSIILRNVGELFTMAIRLFKKSSFCVKNRTHFAPVKSSLSRDGSLKISSLTSIVLEVSKVTEASKGL
jgi:hypothetical protein